MNIYDKIEKLHKDIFEARVALCDIHDADESFKAINKIYAMQNRLRRLEMKEASSFSFAA
jgi:hypothetical protein